MIQWRFIITDNTSGSPVVTTLANEPQGWADLNIKLKRDPKIHGVFADYSINSLKYNGDGYTILKNAYDTFGINADVSLEIQWACGAGYESLYQGKFLFDMYKETSGTICGCEVGLMNIGCLNTFTSRLDQKVNLDTDKDFAGNILPSYDGLGKTIDLPSKGIVKQCLSVLSEDAVMSATQSHTVPAGVGTYNRTDLKYIPIPMDVTAPNELSTYTADGTTISGSTPSNQFVCSEAATYEFKIAFKLSFTIESWSDTRSTGIGTCASAVIATGSCSRIIYATPGGGCPAGITTSFSGLGAIDLDFNLVVNNSTYTLIQRWSKAANCVDSWSVNDSVSYTTSIALSPGDEVRFELRFSMNTDYDKALVHANDIEYRYDATIYQDISASVLSKYTISAVTYTAPTPCKVYMVNESFARITEAISEGCMTMYSDYLGRTDAEPYTSISDGCGALESITKGLLIRQATLQGNEPVMAVSFKDLFEAFCSIHNLGYGIEDDSTTGGKMIRIEPMEYFFPSTIIFSADKIPMVDFANSTAKQYGKFNFGYEKFEAEEFNGLDEFLSKREYRSPLNSKNILEQVCKFISSGYSIEVTRRIGNADSKDWRLDNDYFVICLKRGYMDSLVVEQGGITDDVNIIDPTTIYNFRISPMRNAMRWMKYILGMFAIPLDSTKSYLQFTDGTGNYFAEGKLTTGCILEAVALQENGDLSIDLFDTMSEGTPIWSSKHPKFTYPLSRESFKAILANPTGVVEYECAGITREGYISELDYKPASGDATFTLIPKY
jgi:hypothetical protein